MTTDQRPSDDADPDDEVPLPPADSDDGGPADQDTVEADHSAETEEPNTDSLFPAANLTGFLQPVDLSHLFPPVDVSGLFDNYNALANISPPFDVGEMMKNVGEFTSIEIPSSILQSIGSAVIDTSKFKFPAFDMPSFDFSWLFNSVTSPLQDIAAEIIESARRTMQGTPTAAARLNRGMLPPVLAEDADEFEALDVIDLVANHGVPVWVVPRRSIARALVRAPNTSARRSLLNRRYDAILADCAEALRNSEENNEWTALSEFAADAVDTCRSGHAAAGQALLASVLDTAVVRMIPSGNKGDVLSGKREREERHRYFDELDVQANYAWVPAWHAYFKYDAPSEVSIPRDFSRHASAHSVHRRQYNKRNAAWAALTVTNMLVALSRGMIDGPAIVQAARAAKFANEGKGQRDSAN